MFLQFYSACGIIISQGKHHNKVQGEPKMTNMKIAEIIITECDQFIEDKQSYEAYLMAMQYDETQDIKYLKKAVKIYNNLTGAGIKVAA